MKIYLNHLEDPDGDLWKIAQDIKRLSDTLSSYNLALSFVDRTTWAAIELDFNVQLKAEDGTVEGEYNEQRPDSEPKWDGPTCGEQCFCH